MTKIKDYKHLPKLSKKQSHDPFLIALLAFLTLGLLFGGATMYRKTVLENQRLLDTIETVSDKHYMIIEAPAECGEQLKNTVGESSLLIMKLK